MMAVKEKGWQAESAARVREHMIENARIGDWEAFEVVVLDRNGNDPSRRDAAEVMCGWLESIADAECYLAGGDSSFSNCPDCGDNPAPVVDASAGFDRERLLEYCERTGLVTQAFLERTLATIKALFMTAKGRERWAGWDSPSRQTLVDDLAERILRYARRTT
jgi:hypothetical protein